MVQSRETLSVQLDAGSLSLVAEKTTERLGNVGVAARLFSCAVEVAAAAATAILLGLLESTFGRVRRPINLVFCHPSRAKVTFPRS